MPESRPVELGDFESHDPVGATEAVWETTIGPDAPIGISNCSSAVARREVDIEVRRPPRARGSPVGTRGHRSLVRVGNRVIYLQCAVTLPPNGRGTISLYYSFSTLN